MRRYTVIVAALAALAACAPANRRPSDSASSLPPSAMPSPTQTCEELRPSEEPTPTAASHTPLPAAPRRPITTKPPSRFVAVTDDGSIVVADTATGRATKTLVEGEGCARRPDLLALGGSTVYFTTQAECPRIMAVPVDGGSARHIADGISPAASPDGTKLAWTTSNCAPPARLIIRDFTSGRDRSWPLPDDLPDAGSIDFWEPDGRHLILTQCGVDACSPVRFDTTQAKLSFRLLPLEELDERCCFVWGSLPRGTTYIATVHYGDMSGHERHPLIEIDRKGKIYELEPDGHEYGPLGFDASGQHLLTFYKDDLAVWSDGTPTVIGPGYHDALWLE